MFIKKLFFLFFPLNPLKYYLFYFNIVETIWLQQSQVTNRLKFKILLINMALAIKAAHYLYLSQFPPTTTLEGAIQFDAMALLVVGKPSFNLLACLGTTLTGQQICSQLLGTNYALNTLLYDTLVRKDGGFFIKKHYKGKLATSIVRDYFRFAEIIFLSLVFLFGE